MIKLLMLPVFIMLSCGSVKSNRSTANTDSVLVQPANPSTGSVENENDNNTNEVYDISALPRCIKNKIDSFKLKAAHERPQSVVQYTYKRKKVYYVVMPCCDFFNEVYDAKCNYLGAPDGGFTGKGDGKIPDFVAEAKNEKLIWKAPK